jgi:hypothetical protein
MKTVLAIFALLTLSLGLSSFEYLTSNYTSVEEVDTFEIPENINTIFQNSCYGCHNNDAKAKKAKIKFNIDKLSSYKKSKLVSKLNKVVKVMKKDKMPTEKILKKYPEMALSADEKEMLINWAESTAEALVTE